MGGAWTAAAAAAGQSVPPIIANKTSPVQTWLPSSQVAEERHPGRVSDRHTTVRTRSVCPQHVSIGGLTAAVVLPNPFRWPVSKLAGCLRWLNPLHNPPRRLDLVTRTWRDGSSAKHTTRLNSAPLLRLHGGGAARA